MRRGFAEKKGKGSCGDSARGWALAGIRDGRNDGSGLACHGYCYAEFFEFCAGGALFFSAWIAADDFA